MKKYLIIGSGIAGLSAAEGIRQVDKEGEITIVSKETNLPYSRPMLTKSPFISFNPENWTIHSDSWFKENNIKLVKSEEIADIDYEGRVARGKEGEEFQFDKLILATGSSNFIPPFKGKDRKGIFTIREAEDIYNIKTYCYPGAKAVVIGGGVIGIEAAMELLRYGVKVTVLEAMPYLMMRQIDEEMSDRIREALAGEIEIETGVSIEEISGNDEMASDEEKRENSSAIGVRLTDGRFYPADFVIVACGTRANTGLGERLGLEINRGIVIDNQGTTSLPDVFAAGDVAEYQGINYALWSQGILQGKVAGYNAAGREAFFDTIDSTLIINSPFMSVAAIGDLGKKEGKSYEIKYLASEDSSHSFFINPKHGEFFEKQYYIDGKLVGAEIMGNLSNLQDRKDEILGDTGVKYV